MKKIWVATLGCAWVAALVAGTLAMSKFDFTPGETQAGSVQWPAASCLARIPGQPTLVMVAHPDCPCSQASLEEFGAIVAERKGAVTAYVVFVLPKDAGAEWMETDNCQAAAKIPGVHVVFDRGGSEARNFGGETSGDVTLYGHEGQLQFHGGVTAARGALGRNAGQAALSAWLDGSSAPATTPVFGCPLEADKLRKPTEVRP